MPLLNPLALQAFASMLPPPDFKGAAKSFQSLNLGQSSKIESPKQLDIQPKSSPVSVAPVDTSNADYDKDIADKAQQYINGFAKGRESLVTGKDIAIASKAYNVPPSLMLAQAQVENGFMLDPNAKRARKTNNPMSVGLFDSGVDKFKFPDISSGIMAYAKLVNNDYLQGGKITLDQLLEKDKFVNSKGKRFASDVNYEAKVKSVVNKVKKLGLN